MRDNFTDGYINCALWSFVDDEDNPMDAFDMGLSPEATATMKADCAKFQADNAALLEQADEYQSRGHQGHDFWLTRNAGFWEGDYPEALGDALTDASKKFGRCDLYVGGDSQIHIM